MNLKTSSPAALGLLGLWLAAMAPTVAAASSCGLNWEACGVNPNGVDSGECCRGLTCQGGGWSQQCRPDPNRDPNCKMPWGECFGEANTQAECCEGSYCKPDGVPGESYQKCEYGYPPGDDGSPGGAPSGGPPSSGPPPTPKPTPAPVPQQQPSSAQNFVTQSGPTDGVACSLPSNQGDFAVIAKFDVLIGSKTVYKGIAAGGNIDRIGSENFQYCSNFVGEVVAGGTINTNSVGFKNGCFADAGQSDALSRAKYDHYVWLTEHVIQDTVDDKDPSENQNQGNVFVRTSGGTYNFCQFFTQPPQDQDKGQTVIFFNTEDDITLTKCPGNNRKWGAVVIAPKANVYYDGSMDFVDGMVVAKNFRIQGTSTQSQLHGEHYRGNPALKCRADTSTYSSMCEDNLGDAIAPPSSAPATYPGIGGCGSPKGYDNGVSFLVGGSYESIESAEIEGRLVVVGDFDIAASHQALNSLVFAGLGSCIIPEDGEAVMIVGGDINANNPGGTTISHPANGVVYYGGSYTGGQLNYYNSGTIVHKPDLDMSRWTNLIEDLKVKSKYWSTLAGNGDFQPLTNSNIYFRAGNSDCVQVFNLDTSDVDFSGIHGMHANFDSSLNGKTILINVKANANGVATVANIANFFAGDGSNHFNFNRDVAASIIWNFFDATEVIIGNGPNGNSGNGEFTGTILAPFGNLEFSYPGASGRTIVGGDVTHIKGGSEFHNIKFDPVCPLPPPPECFPTPTTGPTTSPAPTGCADPMAATLTDTTGTALPYGSTPIIVTGSGKDDEYVLFDLVQDISGGTIKHISLSYRDRDSGNVVCDTIMDVAAGSETPFKAACVSTLAEVDLYVYTGYNFDSEGVAACTLPTPTSGNFRLYEFEIPCDLECSEPTGSPTSGLTETPTSGPTSSPTKNPTSGPTSSPTKNPTSGPTTSPTKNPTSGPTTSPTKNPTSGPTTSPTKNPTDGPTTSPTTSPAPTNCADPMSAVLTETTDDGYTLPSDIDDMPIIVTYESSDGTFIRFT
eukprot:CAMPEP_0119570160 /NCGR_PEP_ID=MMETSP1352-20130426/43474_1 /TAXON_ID=265584 /ORGANISM="Stauroneis constricta, Strain CCMP1120" /LENGTH=1012 /DNA_ID=CAMNT_0007619825 /DNA_START=289 /DNA_END=3323 /DNA_ORIENTATION=-